MGGFGTNAYRGTGFKTVDGKDYMFLTDENDNEYTIREGGKVYDEGGNVTDFTVDSQRNLYENGEHIDNIFSKTSPLKPFKHPILSYITVMMKGNHGPGRLI